jgi:5-bromo-4-chloroindolyl phosphate hydrolysis protein
MTRGGWASVLTALAVAGAMGGVLLAEVRTGPLVAAIVALIAYFILHAALERTLPKRAAKTPSIAAPLAGTEDAIVTLLADAEVAAVRLDAVGQATHGTPGLRVRELARLSRAVALLVMQDPSRLAGVMRLFTYYLPAAADLAEDRARLTGAAGQARLREIDSTLARLTEAFAGFERAALEPDLRDVDIDLKLIDQALASDNAISDSSSVPITPGRKMRG